MIYTVTLNPAVDCWVSLPRLIPGVTNRADSQRLTVGGKGVNVSRVLAALGVPSTALGFAAGFTGEAVLAGIPEPEVTVDFLRLRSGVTRINLKIAAGEEETEINAPGPAVEPEALAALAAKLEALRPGDTLILSGSVPAGTPEDCYARLLAGTAEGEIRTVVDAAGPLLRHALPRRPFLVKPNRQELSQLFGVPADSPETVERLARRLQGEGARNVLVSLGGDGALLLTEEGEILRQKVVPGRAVNTVGAGDSMVAGFVAGFERTGDYGWALKLGSACGMATAYGQGLADGPAIQALLARMP